MKLLMNWWNIKRAKSSTNPIQKKSVSDEVWELKKDIDDARRGWQSACRFFQYAVERDEVDYAVYHLMAAEQRYAMLLRKAKALSAVDWPSWAGGEFQ